MTLVFVICEGPTEETFVDRVLKLPLRGLGVTVSAKTIETSPGHAGGALNYERVRRALCRFLANKSSPVVTTLFDLHRLDKRFPRVAEAKALPDLGQRLQLLAAAFHADIVGEAGCRPDRFIPYIQPYEFEALLFSDVATLAGVEPEWKKVEPILAAIRSQAASPEHINERPNSNPAAHLEREFKAPHYRKTRHGPIAAQRIGLSRMEAECAFFAGWMSRLRSLAG